ncbi:flavin reductase (NADPH) [Euwallacea fornicatus]|uniref:flavin reductase (NADPH) n=1 Tax=Euwallacea fornicatus TaxID=995702 RepID=UPI00338E4E0E
MATIVIFGATGTTGLCATEAAVKKGLVVRALLRDPSKLSESLSKQVETIQGNILNYDDVFKTVQGTSAVIVALGTRHDLKPTSDLSEGLKNIVKAMKNANVEVVSICLSAFLFDGMNDRVPSKFKDITEEHRRMYEIIKDSGLKYVAVFPPHIADQPSSTFEVTFNKYIGRIVSKYDLGQFLVDAISQPNYYGQVMGIVSK